MLSPKCHLSVSNLISKPFKCVIKMKSNINFRDQTWDWAPAKYWVKYFILPCKYHVPNSYQRFWHTLGTWQYRNNNSIGSYHLSSDLVISTPSDVQPVYNLDPSAFFRYKRKAKKSLWNTSDMWLKFAQIEDIFFRINYGIRGRQYWKY